MKKIFSFLLIILVLSSISCRIASASGNSPAVIPEVFCNNLRITADNSSPDQIGIINAYHMTTKELIWSKSIYGTFKDTISEEPLTPIKSMKYFYGKLVIVNEDDKVFELDPSTGNPYHYDAKGIALGSICLAVLLALSMTIYYLSNKIKRKNS